MQPESDAPIDNLPLELVHHIIELGSEDSDYRERQSELCRLSLVSRRWTAEAQRQLFLDVRLTTFEQYKAFEQSTLSLERAGSLAPAPRQVRRMELQERSSIWHKMEGVALDWAQLDEVVWKDLRTTPFRRAEWMKRELVATFRVLGCT